MFSHDFNLIPLNFKFWAKNFESDIECLVHQRRSTDIDLGNVTNVWRELLTDSFFGPSLLLLAVYSVLAFGQPDHKLKVVNF
jgi:hypothetical protein